MALGLKDTEIPEDGEGQIAWEAEFGMDRARAAMVDGDLEASIAYTGAGVGLISEILSVREVFEELVQGSQGLAKRLA